MVRFLAEYRNNPMKNIITKIALMICLIVFAAALAGCGDKNDPYAPPTGMTDATDEKADFHLYVPDKWTVDYSTAAAGAYFSAADPSSVSAMAWELEYTDQTVDDWWNTNVEEVSSVFQNFNLESEENITLSDVYGKKYTYTATLGSYDYKIMQAACVKNSTVYLFTYTSLPDNFDEHTGDVDLMLEHFTIKD